MVKILNTLILQNFFGMMYFYTKFVNRRWAALNQTNLPVLLIYQHIIVCTVCYLMFILLVIEIYNLFV